MAFLYFGELFPDLARRETRAVTVTEGSRDDLPVGQAAIAAGVLAVDLAFYREWMGEEDLELAVELEGPSLHLGGRQSQYAPALLRFVEQVLLADDTYVARLRRHYAMFRAKIDASAVSDDTEAEAGA